MAEGNRLARRIWLFLAVSGLPILMIGLAAVLIIQAFVANQQHEISEAGSRLIHLRRTLEAGANLKRLIAQRDSDTGNRSFIHGKDEGARQAGLQSKLKVFAEQAGANIISLNGVEADEHNSVKYTAIKVEIDGSSKAVENFMRLLEESSDPVLAVRDVSMRSAASAILFEQTARSISSEMTILGVVQVGDDS